MGRLLRVIVVLAMLLGLAAGGFYWFKAQQAKAPSAGASPAASTAGGARGGMPQGPTPVVTVAAGLHDVTASISSVGSLVAGEAAEIHAEIAGQIKKILFEEGQPVKKGAVLIEIDTSLIATDLAKARATYEVSQSTFNRDDQLKNRGFVSEQKWDESKAEMQAARSAIEGARIRIEKASIKAPFDGIAGLRNFSAGDYAETGQMLTTVVSIDPLKLEFSVPEKSYGMIRTGLPILFEVDSWPGEKFPGEIYAVDPRIDPQTRNFAVKAQVANPGARLRPGMYARIDIETEKRSSVLMVPEEALIPRGTDNYVFVAENNKAVMKKIGVGIRQNGMVEVTEGITPGEAIITDGTVRLREGGDIAPQEKPQETPQAGQVE